MSMKNWEQQQLFVKIIKHDCFESGKFDPHYLSSKSVVEAQEFLPLFREVDQGHFLCLLKQAASEWILDKDNKKTNSESESDEGSCANNGIGQLTHAAQFRPSAKQQSHRRPNTAKASCKTKVSRLSIIVHKFDIFCFVDPLALFKSSFSLLPRPSLQRTGAVSTPKTEKNNLQHGGAHNQPTPERILLDQRSPE